HVGVNAVSHLVRWLGRIERNVVTLLPTRRHPLVSPPSLTVSTLAGGVAPNVVPDRAEAVIDRRTLPGETLDAARAELPAAAQASPRALTCPTSRCRSRRSSRRRSCTR